jgi:glycosyltransferase involved in cell wall biosynthesis
MIKIAYDITVLGQGYINAKAKTGVYRVVDSLLKQLLDRKDIEIDLVAFNGLNNIWDSVSGELFIEAQAGNIKHQYQPCAESKYNLLNLYKFAVKSQKKLIKLSNQYSTSLYKPALALQLPFKLLGKFDVDFKFNSQANIYHSPFYALPPKETINNLNRILTIYDLIPVLDSHKFTQNIYDKYLKMIASIDLDRDWVTCISENTKNDFCNYTGMNPARVFVTPLAAAAHFFPVNNKNIIRETIKKYQIPDRPYLLSLCTLEPRKNLSFLIRCFAKIILENSSIDLNLVLVGVSGWKNNDIFKTAQKNPLLKDRIIFTGYIPDEDLSAIYSGATAFIYPSLYEGFGLPPLEAMQCGTPVITSNTSSLPEVVGDAGIMINPTDEDALCQAILTIIQDSQLRKTLSEKGLERAQQFSWSKCAEETVKVYHTALNFS